MEDEIFAPASNPSRNLENENRSTFNSEQSPEVAAPWNIPQTMSSGNGGAMRREKPVLKKPGQPGSQVSF
jgi:hypothetical protein